MQEAGRILLMPKGDYSASATYAMLDLVNHSGASWVCKKDCTGKEPSDSNTEFWQRFGTAVDLSNYLPKSGGTITTDSSARIPQLPLALVNGVDENGSVVRYDDKKGTLGHLGFVEKNVPIFSNVNGVVKELLHTGNMASHVLPLDGGGTVSKNNMVVMAVRHTGGSNPTVMYHGANGAVGGLGFSESGVPAYLTPDVSKFYSLLHTGNKPTGTYTGNGSAEQRTINTGGVGSILAVWGGGAIIFLTASGIMGATNNQTIDYKLGKWVNGNYTMNTDNVLLNRSGIAYSWAVL